MAYDNKTHRNTHQLKSRLNDDAYADLKAEALSREIQPGALVRDLTLAALRFKEDYGYFPLIDDNELDGFPALAELALELKVQPAVLAHDLIRAALQARREQDAITQVNDKQLSA
ncbi:hypothetical protein IMW75_13490 [Pseudomonas gregormendelii]|uniref:Uncharacterized protein n=1 Tax=Pseudomonas gregormendelii TaxID=1628277 RepID=A0ABS3AGZ8_9PSED|nr:hypothetical protein [Pseudomonas gregormendelii]MBN3966285.1 hypothetical protein [Pseudomonas gregormendelii]